MVIAQDKELSSYEINQKKLEAQYKDKEAALRKQKASIEDNIVTVVVQQIRDAQKAEREAVREELGKEHQDALDNLHHKYRSRVAILTQELQDSRSANEQIKDT